MRQTESPKLQAAEEDGEWRWEAVLIRVSTEAAQQARNRARLSVNTGKGNIKSEW